MQKIQLVPTMAFLTKGVGRHREQLTSFEMVALQDAGVAPYNLVTVSSIFPPHCKLVTREQGLSLMTPGQIAFVVMSRCSDNEPRRLMSAAIGLALPGDKNQYGYISEHHAFGQTDQKAGDYAEDLAASMLATTLGVDFDPDAAYDEKKEIWRISGKIVRTMNATQSAVGHKDGIWTTVVAMAVFLF